MKILFAGCSNLVNDSHILNKQDIWKKHIFGDNANITNISWPGVGNQFIRSNTIDFLENNHVDFVYVQFTGLARFDFAVNKNYTTGALDNTTHVKGYKRSFMCSGGRVGTWLGNIRTKQIFMPIYYDKNEYDHVSDDSIQNVDALLNYLEIKKINYCWNFYYDITDPKTTEVDMYDGKVSTFPKILNTKNWLQSDPHSYCFLNKGLQDDGCHFVNSVYEEWVKSIKEKVKILI
jgi:hypothetical protein